METTRIGCLVSASTGYGFTFHVAVTQVRPLPTIYIGSLGFATVMLSFIAVYGTGGS